MRPGIIWSNPPCNGSGWPQQSRDFSRSTKQETVAYADVVWVVWWVAAKPAVAGCPEEHHPAKTTFCHFARQAHAKTSTLHSQLFRQFSRGQGLGMQRNEPLCASRDHMMSDRTAMIFCKKHAANNGSPMVVSKLYGLTITQQHKSLQLYLSGMRIQTWP